MSKEQIKKQPGALKASRKALDSPEKEKAMLVLVGVSTKEPDKRFNTPKKADGYLTSVGFFPGSSKKAPSPGNGMI